jgi:glycerol-3-phosphate acyltransferase PlsY
VTVGLVLVVLGYLAGSIPFGFLAGRYILKVDVRTVGSGNIGATNVARAGGKGIGAAVFLLDALKAIVPMLVTRRVFAGSPDREALVVAIAAAAFVGHLFPVWLRFKGGKGVATAFGIFLVLAPWAALAGIATFGGVYLTTRISSLGSLSGTAVCALGTLVFRGAGSVVSWAALGVGVVIFLRHRENIRRILSGEEKRKMRV